MRPPLIQRPGRNVSPQHRERGVTLALVALAIFSVIAMAGLSIDVGTLYQSSAEAQRAADAAALAAARVLSSSGLTGDPGNSSGNWSTICTMATQMAQTVAAQNLVGGAPPLAPSVTFSAGDKSSDCSATGGIPVSFGVNPTVTVQVSQTGLSTYFARIWGRRGTSVSATATAEAFNPSNSNTYSPSASVVPVQPRCVKPWMVPNIDPLNPPPNPGYCAQTGLNQCKTLVSPTNSTITNPGILASGSGIIGETFWLVADCEYNQPNCVFRDTPPQANTTKAKHFHAEDPPNLEYLPGQTLSSSTAIPSGSACSGVSGNYAEAIAGCDQRTQYQCGVSLANTVDLAENPSPTDTPNGAQCLIHSSNGTTGQDTLVLNGATPPVPTSPFQIQAGSGNPLIGAGAATSDVITSSTSVVALPIYDSTSVAFVPGTTKVTVIGFLQVFINSIGNFGNVNVTVLNVSGCGNTVAAGTASLHGTSPVPIRLITPP